MKPGTGLHGPLLLEEPLIRVGNPSDGTGGVCCHCWEYDQGRRWSLDAGQLRCVDKADTQTPYELLRRSHRSAQRQVEKDFVNVQAQLSQLLKALSGDEEKEKALSLAKLDTASERIRGLKRKLDDLQPNPDPGSQSHVIRERIKYVEDVLLGTRLKKPDEGRGKPADVSYRERSESKEQEGKEGKEGKEEKKGEDGLAAPQPERAEKRVSFLDADGDTRDAIAAQLDTISGNTTPATPAKPMDG